MKHSAVAIKIAVILLLTICVTAGEGQSNSNIIDSNRAQMLVPFSQVTKDDFVIDVSQGATQYMDGAIAIPYTNFIKDKKLRSMDEISGILRDAGVPCDRRIYIYGRCAPCGGGSAPASFTYLILASLGYQVRLIDDTIEQWAASGGRTTDKPAIKPKTNCSPVAKTNNSGGDNQTRIATGNGSKTEEGFAGTVTSQTANPNGTYSEEVPYTFEANSTPAQDMNSTTRQFENAMNDTISTADNGYQEEMADDDFQYGNLPDPTKLNLRLVYSKQEFYHRYKRLLRDSALSGKPLTERQIKRINQDWDHAQEEERKHKLWEKNLTFFQRWDILPHFPGSKPDYTPQINTPNCGPVCRG
jgi:hypothetical protein